MIRKLHNHRVVINAYQGTSVKPETGDGVLFLHKMRGDFGMQEQDDLRFLIAKDKWFSVRAAVLLVHGQDVLVKQAQLQDGTSGLLIPGGAVKFGESGLEAGAREMREELQLDHLDLQMVGITENFWPVEEGVQAHQIMMLMLTKITQQQFNHLNNLDMQSVDLPEGTNLVWLPFDTVRRAVKPAAVGKLLGTDGGLHYGVDRRE